MKVLGLDLSLTSTGYVILQWPRASEHPDLTPWWVSRSGAIRPKSVGVERLAQISTEVCQLAYEGFMPVDAVWIEEYAFSRHDAHAHATGELHGVVLLDLYRAGMPVHKVGITTWRKRVTGRGNIKKDEVRVELYKRYGIEFPNTDIAEAFGVAMHAYLEATVQNKPVARPRRRAVAS